MDTNVKLSKNEISLAADAAFILTKNNIISKAAQLFGNVSECYKNEIAKHNYFPPEVTSVSPKIYKGEKYLHLPYVMLDYPRCFSAENIFAIRSFFWWGNFFSISIILKGIYLEKYLPLLLKNKHLIQGWYLYKRDDIWQNDFDEDDFILLKENNADIFIKKIAEEKKFIKIAKKIPLQKWNKAYSFFSENYSSLLSAMQA